MVAINTSVTNYRSMDINKYFINNIKKDNFRKIEVVTEQQLEELQVVNFDLAVNSINLYKTRFQYSIPYMALDIIPNFLINKILMEQIVS